MAVLGYTSAADDIVKPRWLQVPKWDNATASDQRSAARNGQDSSLTKTMAGLPPMVSGGPDVLIVCSGVISWPGLTLVSTAAGTVVTCRTTAEDACDRDRTCRGSAELDGDQPHQHSQHGGDRRARHQQPPASFGALACGPLGCDPLADAHLGLRVSPRPG